MWIPYRNVLNGNFFISAHLLIKDEVDFEFEIIS